MTDLDALAAEFVRARTTGSLVPILHERAAISLDEAYAIQLKFATAWVEPGTRTRAGYKISLTNPADQAKLKASEPASGVLFDDSLLANGVTVEGWDGCLIEPELGFTFTSDITGVLTHQELIENTTVAPVIEVPRSRYRDWLPLTNLTAPDIVADNAVAGWVVVGEAVESASLDLAGIAVEVSFDGRIEERGSSSHVLGNPLNALTWLVSKVTSHGRKLPTGTFVSSGTLTAPMRARAGHCAARFSGLGEVSAVFA